MRKILRYVGLLCLGMALMIPLGMGREKDPSLKAPQFNLQCLTSQGSVCTIGGKSDKFTVLLFWTTWCPHCRTAMREMEAYSKEYSDKVRFCAVALGDPPSAVKAYIKALGITFPVGVDPKGTIGSVYGVMGVPTIFVIDPDGYVVDYGYSLPRIMYKLKRMLGS